jgi:hypothetical protein
VDSLLAGVVEALHRLSVVAQFGLPLFSLFWWSKSSSELLFCHGASVREKRKHEVNRKEI